MNICEKPASLTLIVCLVIMLLLSLVPVNSIPPIIMGVLVGSTLTLAVFAGAVARNE